MAESGGVFGTSLSQESMKVIAESIGVGNLPDEAAKDLAEDISYRLKHIVQDAIKFMRHGKRQKLQTYDINRALKIKNLEPIHGFSGKESAAFQSKANNDRMVHFVEQKELDLQEIILKAGESLKLPLEVTLRAHWLSIDGIQPVIPENPLPASAEPEKLANVNPEAAASPTSEKTEKPDPVVGKPPKLRNVEIVQVKQLEIHELSVEQQFYYQKLTEACMTNNERFRACALHSLSVDPGLYEMLPRMITFIAEGVQVNVIEHNLSFLIYLMRMVKALMDNPHLYLDKYLHKLIPSVATCLVAKQMCIRPEIDNHWALRDFAARIMGQICRTFSNSVNNIETRIIRMLNHALTDDQASLTSVYGAIVGLSDLGPEVIKTWIIPNIKIIADRVEVVTDGLLNFDRNVMIHIRTALAKNVTPILKTIRAPPDFLEEYKQDFGCLGPILCSAVIKFRVQSIKSNTKSWKQPKSKFCSNW